MLAGAGGGAVGEWGVVAASVADPAVVFGAPLLATVGLVITEPTLADAASIREAWLPSLLWRAMLAMANCAAGDDANDA